MEKMKKMKNVFLHYVYNVKNIYSLTGNRTRLSALHYLFNRFERAIS